MPNDQLPNSFQFVGSGGEFHPFSQGMYLGGTNSQVQVAMSDPSRQENVSGGFCRELTRMWLWARNHSDRPPGAGLPGGAMTGTDELKLLHHNARTLLVRQGMSQANDYSSEELVGVKGLSVRNRTDAFSKKVLAARVMRKPGRLYMGMVAFASGGWHAVGFDSRGDRFHFFDPNTGHWIHSRKVMEKHLRDFLENYNAKNKMCFGETNKSYLREYGKSPGW